MKIWVLVISHKGGENVYASRTEQGIRDRLYEFVEVWWNVEMRDPDTGESPAMPQDEEAVNMYFNEVSDEWYRIDEVELED